MTHPDPFTSNTAMDKIMSEDRKADEGGGPAFPSYSEGMNSFGAVYPINDTGMSLRDSFAAVALNGGFTRGLSSTGETLTRELRAKDAYLIADAMIEARKVKP
jgi:hypothetical protein